MSKPSKIIIAGKTGCVVKQLRARSAANFKIYGTFFLGKDDLNHVKLDSPE
jgi:hypothetical protein